MRLTPAWHAGAGALVACALACGNGTAPAPARVDSATALAARGGGCRVPGVAASGLDLLALVNPEWAPVVDGATPTSSPELIHGTAVESHVSLSDFPSTHVRYDQNTALRLDASDERFLATGNSFDSGEEPPSTLLLEWELGAYPAWAWAGEGDRVVALGRWIFDCGHGDPTPRGTCAGTSQPCSYDTDCGLGSCAGAGGTCRGSAQRCWTDAECPGGAACDGVTFHHRTELHPPQAIAVLRAGRGGELADGQPVPVTRADVLVSGDGGAAGDACVVTHASTPLAASCFPLAQPLALLPADRPPLATDFAFQLPLPAGGGGTPSWRVLPRDPPSPATTAVPAAVDVAVGQGGGPHLDVTVRMSRPVGGTMPTGFAGTVLAGWSVPPPSSLAHLRVTVEGVTVRSALKPAPTGDALLDAPPGWSMQVAVDGEWQELAGLDAVAAASEGATIPLQAVFDQYVDRGGALRLQAAGSSAACVDRVMGQSLSTSLVLFGFDATRLARCLASSRLDAGTIDASFAGPGFGAGEATQVLVSEGGAGGTCSVTPRACREASDCPSGERCDGAYALGFRLEEVVP